MARFFYSNKSLFTVFLVLAMFLFAGCGGGGEIPLENLKRSLSNVPTYSIILENMKADGNFIKTYYHQYRVVRGDDVTITDWLKVPEKFYKKFETYMGMTIAAKKEGEMVSGVAPPGYHFVGDSRYGHWRRDSRGNSFWEFYGKYRLVSDLFGGWYRPVYRSDYEAYGRFKSRGVPFYGLKNEYGTKGTVVKKTKPDFYARRMARERSKKTSFTQKVAKRVGRSRTGFRGRSGRYGK